VDAFDRLPTPYGLLRGGVAPDHQQMKSVGKYYDRVASNPNFSFYGNVKIGHDLSLDELRECYDACVVCCGAETDKKLGIPGESLVGSYAATEFVGWYNGHPDYQNRVFDFSQKKVAIIGQGNVAVDVARILAKTQDELSKSDITDAALRALSESKIEDIYLIGRRGPVQSAFTKMEIEELGHLDGCDIIVNPKDLEGCDPGENHKAQKNMEVLHALSKKPMEGKPKRIHVCFYQSPLEILGENQVSGIVMGINTLDGERAVLTEERTTLDVGLVFRSVGYYGVPFSGLPFDEKRGLIPNQSGRVSMGTYVSGWIKRGPSGVLGSNKPDSSETVSHLLADVPTLTPAKFRSSESLFKDKNLRVVTFSDWLKINDEEISRGSLVGKPREKFTSLESVLSFLDS
jgi:ferredoxin--NADP+ reductase